MKKIKLEDMKLSKEIKQYGKINKKDLVSLDELIAKKVFVSTIPYKGFEIILGHPIVIRKKEDFYFFRSKYGWWTFCGMKLKLDKLDKQLLILPKEKIKFILPNKEKIEEENRPTNYGDYRREGHHFCNDNQVAHHHLRDDPIQSPHPQLIHPNKMVNIIKNQIDKFYKDRKKLENENKNNKKTNRV